MRIVAIFSFIGVNSETRWRSILLTANLRPNSCLSTSQPNLLYHIPITFPVSSSHILWRRKHLPCSKCLYVFHSPLKICSARQLLRGYLWILVLCFSLDYCFYVVGSKPTHNPNLKSRGLVFHSIQPLWTIYLYLPHHFQSFLTALTRWILSKYKDIICI